MTTATDDELTERQREALQFVEQFIKRTGKAPTFREIATGLDLASSHPAYRLMMALWEKGFVTWTANARSLKVLKPLPTS